ncbi:hypothetical protein SNN69_001506 [Cronobacter sakazakii]|nr:hypothetical protein [Cronobacter sakazakii]
MKLIDLLVRELPKHGGWPEGVSSIAQRFNGALFEPTSAVRLLDGLRFDSVENRINECVTREQYESALQKPVWDGEGLPPVGCECEAIYGRDAWFKVKIIAYDSGRVIGRWLEGDRDDYLLDYSHQEAFRPIRSEADRKREIGVMALATACGDVVPFKYGDRLQDGEIVGAAWYELYDKIAAGEVAGIRIE